MGKEDYKRYHDSYVAVQTTARIPASGSDSYHSFVSVSETVRGKLIDETDKLITLEEKLGADHQGTRTISVTKKNIIYVSELK